MRILAIDPGTKTGWAFSDGETSLLESGTNVLKLRAGEAKTMRYIRFSKWLDDMFLLMNPDLVIFEKTHMRGYEATKFMMNLIGRIETACNERSVPYTDVHTGTLKKFATGHGKGSKAEMMRLVAEKHNFIVDSDDEADAIHMLDYARENYEPAQTE